MVFPVVHGFHRFSIVLNRLVFVSFNSCLGLPKLFKVSIGFPLFFKKLSHGVSRVCVAMLFVIGSYVDSLVAVV